MKLTAKTTVKKRKYILPALTCLTFGSLLAGCGGKDSSDAAPSKMDGSTGAAAETTSGTTAPDSSKSGATGAAGAPSLSNPGGGAGK